MPFIDGSITASTAAAVTAASMALPPSCSTFRPAAEAIAWLVAIMPCRPTAADRVPRMLPAGRSPGAIDMVAMVVVMMGCDCSGGEGASRRRSCFSTAAARFPTPRRGAEVG